MATLPQRTTNNTAAEHVADHNSLHDFFNTPLGSGFNIVTTEGNWTATQRFIGTAGNIIFGVQLAADSNSRARFTGDGKLEWGSGTATPDVVLERGAADRLQLADEFRINRTTAGDDALTIKLNADTNPRFVVNADGPVEWGPGNAGTDIQLSRGAANTLDLASGDSLRIIDGTFQMDPTNLTILLDSKAAPSFGVHSLIISRAAGNVASIIRAAASQTANLLNIENSAAALQSRFNKAGFFMTRKNAAPADADIVANEMAVWFDPTNLAAAAKFKGKTADGTVVTATVAMA